jgi:hypothetical protein
MPIILRSIIGTVFLITLFTIAARADTFEFLTFTPPAGWTMQNAKDGVVYKRATGIGAISFYTSYAATGSAAAEFEKMWQARLGSVVPGGAPVPKLDRDGEFAVAIGGQRVNAQDATVSFSMVTFVGRGRALGVVMVTAGDEVQSEVTAFLNTVSIGSGTASATNSTAAFEVEFDVPSGYLSKRESGMIVFTPVTVNDQTPCLYGIAPAQNSSGNLESDARGAFRDVVPGWQIKNDRYTAMKGIAAAGWPYYWFRTDVQRLAGSSYEYATAMTMAFPGTAGRTNILWGVGNPARCLLDDIAFARLFHSLRPRGWTSDGGKALANAIQGTWRNSQNVGMAQYKFLPNGKYEYGIGTITRLGIFETTASSASDGRWELRGSELIITPNVRGRAPIKYRVRIYDEFVTGRWTRAMSLLDEASKPALEVQYMRVEQ